MGPFGRWFQARFDECRAIDGAAHAAGTVAQIGDFALHIVAIFVGEWHWPKALAGSVAGLANGIDKAPWPAEQTGVVLAQSDTDGACQRGDVDDALRPLALGVRHAVDQHEPTLGVSVDDLDRLAAQAGDDVTWFRGVPTGQVLGARRHANDVDLQA